MRADAPNEEITGEKKEKSSAEKGGIVEMGILWGYRMKERII